MITDHGVNTFAPPRDLSEVVSRRAVVVAQKAESLSR